MENFDLTLVDWSRGQFALTAMFHWIFVPLTLGLAFIIAIMETIYVRTGDEKWKTITKFWAKLFGINFAIGIATGIILEFEFGTNWSNYSWFVGDIFGAPLAIEGIMAFFLESTFIAVMFFGWNKVSKRFHLLSTWLVAIGANLSALWILVANAWMQNPVGMAFNPDTARNEMVDFWAILFSPTAINKFLHTMASGYVLAAVFVVGISAWFLLKKRNTVFAKQSIVVASVFGIVSSVFLIFTGDESAREMAKVQPMKFAAMEALAEGRTNVPLIAIGFLEQQPTTTPDGELQHGDFAFKIEIPNMLSYMTFLDPNAYIPGIKDLVNGYHNPRTGQDVPSYSEKIRRGKEAITTLKMYKEALRAGDTEKKEEYGALFDDPEWVESTFRYFGFGYYNDDNLAGLVPNVPLSFYSFHLMVILSGHFLALFVVMLIFVLRNRLEKMRWLLYVAIWTIPLVYIASQAGWILAEMGRQPWVIQDLMPTLAAVSQLDASTVQVTFWLFAVTFTTLFIAEIKIMITQIKKGMTGGQ
ncbi:MAG: cytochrome ubiquinol oxidase subunit I [Bacteroidales bacterium]|jgi:cytochrome d ubiquinol oxidase subunit I|nr:cytochrome ubiquinol oxidase subunit I [Bacteroidales bacterium]NCU36821.1 cytochrome ubiquinol oxidase subunit I [Candidatus Falkowbacteria bacterium]MDD2632430.1 cytochrome ubiquinol oxidase subunit I [Bacteroidales bacterium]MDD4177386.1 cytochrome ubiquinol oxidase subunit I [Bacteroidales bacterium]MDD4741313.1 cytochrome ubiquinol oxidase subunit I [Bacteroidales bacterium]